jgi:hypothetical protein
VSLQTRLQDLATAVATDVKQLRTWITGSSSGSIAGLTTTAKTDLVSAINEINAKPTSGAPPAATELTTGIVELADLAEVAAGVDTVRAVTPQGVRQERTALKTEILGAGIPAALDTLKELADAIGDDANFAATVTTGLANRVRVDTAAQGLDATQQANARTNIGTVASSDIGDPTIDLVAVYTTAKT